jgi:NTE family protein
MKNVYYLSFLIQLCVTSILGQNPAPEAVSYLVFEGAGIRGIAYCGALMELDERGITSDIKAVAGTSSGAITAALYAVGYSAQEIYDLIGATDFQKFNDGGGRAVGGIYRLKKKLGWYKGDAFLKWFERQLQNKTGNAHITFEELSHMAKADKNYKDLMIAATSMNHQTTLYFSATTFPNMRIADAVRASMAVPFYFEPLIIDMNGKVIEDQPLSAEHHLCLDGGFTANFCINYFDTYDAQGQQTPARTLGLRIDSDEQILRDQGDRQLCYQEIQTSGDLMKSLYYITKENLNRAYLTEADWARTISISDSDIGPKVKKLSESQKQKLIDAGRIGVKNYYTAQN